MITWIALTLLAASVAVVGILSYSAVFCRFRTLARPVPDALILAAHPDDCVIIAGEYGIEAIRSGSVVRIVYLTSGDADSGSELAHQRCLEAVDAWQRMGLSRSNLYFLELPNSPVEGPLAAAPAQLASARERIATVILSMPEGSAVIFPAVAETHVDHRVLRTTGLEAVISTDRRDLLLLEAPLYNRYFSIKQCPLKSFIRIGRSLPVVRALLRRWVWPMWAGLPNGAPGWRLPRDGDRLEKKREMLRMFHSQNADLLARLFGREDAFRVVVGAREALQEIPHGYVRFGRCWLAPSMMLLWAWVLALVFWLALAGARVISELPYDSWLLSSGLGVGILGLMLAGFRRGTSLTSRAYYLLAGFGLALGTL